METTVWLSIIAAITTIGSAIVAWLREAHKRDREALIQVMSARQEDTEHLFSEYKDYLSTLRIEKDKIEQLYTAVLLENVALKVGGSHANPN